MATGGHGQQHQYALSPGLPALFHLPPSPGPGYALGPYMDPGALLYPGASYCFVPTLQPDPVAALANSFDQISLSSARSAFPQLPSRPRQPQHPPPLARGHEQQNNRRRNATDARQRRYAEATRRTVYICDIDPQVTEAKLAEVFSACGNIMDCRVCGDPHTAMRFAFIEFEDDVAVRQALALSGKPIGNFSLRVRPSKTAIVPVNNGYLPRTDEEHALCARTVYAANIDKRLDKSKVRQFFENLCGPVSRLRLLGDSHHATRIAFVEFCKAESAEVALTCSGALLGALPVRLAPSKTPVRPDPRDPDN